LTSLDEELGLRGRLCSQVLPATDKELTFWGNFFSPKRRPNREEVLADYLPQFPPIHPSDFKVAGEATPGYLYCATCASYMTKYMPRVRLLFTLRNPTLRAYSEYLNKVVDRTVRRYLRKRIDNKMEKALDPRGSAPSFEALVQDVARTMEVCGEPGRTYSMPDPYDDEQERDHCYVNPFVGAGRYARYLKTYLEVVPADQMLLLDFDEWAADPAATSSAMRRVAAFLRLAPFEFDTGRAHNTHLARSVHVNLSASSSGAEVARDPIGRSLSFASHCVLHEFFTPYQQELDELLAQFGYAPMRWRTEVKEEQGGGRRTCSPGHRWRDLRHAAGRVPTGGSQASSQRKKKAQKKAKEKAAKRTKKNKKKRGQKKQVKSKSARGNANGGAPKRKKKPRPRLGGV